jgi:tRNA(fMet)-specific endonuclease VapC
MSLRYLLDTDTVSFALRGIGEVGAHLVARHPSEVGISSITLAELRFGAERRQSRKLHRLIDTFIEAVAVLPFDEKAAAKFGSVGATLADAGTPIGQLDTLIAAHAMSLGLVLVTNNTRHFSKIRGLRIENWLS